MPLSNDIKVDFFNVNYGFKAGESIHQFGRTVNEYGEMFRPVASFGMSSSTLDELVKEKIIPLPNHIKIDVDGLEPLVLDGMNNLLTKDCLRSVLCEITGSSSKISKVENVFRKKGFICVYRSQRLEGNYIFKRQELVGSV